VGGGLGARRRLWRRRDRGRAQVDFVGLGAIRGPENPRDPGGPAVRARRVDVRRRPSQDGPLRASTRPPPRPCPRAKTSSRDSAPRPVELGADAMERRGGGGAASPDSMCTASRSASSAFSGGAGLRAGSCIGLSRRPRSPSVSGDRDRVSPRLRAQRRSSPPYRLAPRSLARTHAGSPTPLRGPRPVSRSPPISSLTSIARRRLCWVQQRAGDLVLLAVLAARPSPAASTSPRQPDDGDLAA